MSSDATAACWGRAFPVDSDGPTAPHTVRLVALAIAEIVNDAHGWTFYGSAVNLATKAGVHRDTVRLVIKHLCAVGVMEVVEERPGRTTMYRWLWFGPRGDSAGSGAGCSAGYPAECSADTPRSVPRRNESNKKVNRKTPANAGATPVASLPGLVTVIEPVATTPEGMARAVAVAWYDHVKATTGHPPAMSVARLIGQVKPLFVAGRDVAAVKRAIAAVHARGATLSTTTIEAEMDGRNGRRARPNDTFNAALDAMRFDDAGNLIR